MATKNTVLGLVGSPNKEGRTNELVTAALTGAQTAGATTEIVQMSDHVLLACKDCLPWVCATNLKCTYHDEGFETMSKKISDAGALVIGSPVYWGDTSAMVRYLFIKMCRVFARSGQLRGLPAFGTAIAGGSGNGLMTGLKPIYHFFRVMQMRPLDPIPATRFDFEQAKTRARSQGESIARMVETRAPFTSQEECWLTYDRLPYIGENRAGERRLLAALTTEAVPADRKKEIEGDLAKADILAASGASLDALTEVTTVYNSALKLLS